MQKKTRILFIMLAAVVLSILTWAVLRPHGREPMYQGKPLSYWLQAYGYAPPNINAPRLHEADDALRSIGTNAIPTLLKMLRAHDSPLKTKVFTWASQHSFGRLHYTSSFEMNVRAAGGFRALGTEATNAIPELIKILDQNLSLDSECGTVNLLADIQPRTTMVVPALLRAAANSNHIVRNNSLGVIFQIHPDPDAAVPVLTKALKDPFALNRAWAAKDLGAYNTNARSSIPALVALLNDPNVNSNSASGPQNPKFVDVRSEVEHALQQIDPDTYARVVTNAAGGEPGRLKAK